MNQLEPGRDAVAIEVESDALVVEWSDGTETRTLSPDLTTRIRAQSFAAQKFLQPKFRRYPVPRI